MHGISCTQKIKKGLNGGIYQGIPDAQRHHTNQAGDVAHHSDLLLVMIAGLVLRGDLAEQILVGF